MARSLRNDNPGRPYSTAWWMRQRREVWRRDGPLCTHRHPNGGRCYRPGTVAHHIRPLSAEGLRCMERFKAESTLDNLELLCRVHHEARHNRTPRERNEWDREVEALERAAMEHTHTPAARSRRQP